MIESDTIKLLRECDTGVQMGVFSIDRVMMHTESAVLTQMLTICRAAHIELEHEIRTQLAACRDSGRAPSAMAKGTSALKMHMKLAADNSDKAVADLMTDGCNMGVKSLSRYLNQYKAADEASKNIAKRLIRLEQKLATDVRPFL